MKVSYLKKEIPWHEQVFAKRSGKTVCVVRYGGFGDMIQTSSIFPYLKEQGYKICVNTQPNGYDIIRNDPHVDEYFIQEEGQVPNVELLPYWERLSKSFDRFINLTEVVEGSLIAYPERRSHRWHPSLRHLIMNVNYYEGIHAVAEVPLPPKAKFYSSSVENKWAASYRKKLGLRNYVIMWSTAGSSCHKVYPYMDQVMARLLHEYPDVHIVLVGDNLCQLAEIGWEREKRVKRKCGKWGIRQSLAFAQQCDLIIGPETGLINSVAFEDMFKILMLSHSTFQNLGCYWKNATVIEPTDAECYPCHQIHFGFDTCNKDESTGAAKCAASIDVDTLYGAVQNIMSLRKAA